MWPPFVFHLLRCEWNFYAPGERNSVFTFHPLFNKIIMFHRKYKTLAAYSLDEINWLTSGFCNHHINTDCWCEEIFMHRPGGGMFWRTYDRDKLSLWLAGEWHSFVRRENVPTNVVLGAIVSWTRSGVSSVITVECRRDWGTLVHINMDSGERKSL